MPITRILLAVTVTANEWVMANMSVLACKINTGYFSIYSWFYWQHKHTHTHKTKPFTGKQFPENCKEKIQMLIVKGISKTRNVYKKHRIANEERRGAGYIRPYVTSLCLQFPLVYLFPYQLFYSSID